MKLSRNWLEEFIDLDDLDNVTLANTITMKICEVDKVASFLPHLDNIIIAEVTDVKPHPDADKLVVCSVNNGKENVQIVTGATNVVAGKKYPLAGVGVTLPDGMTMAKAKLRGVESYGMLCSSHELDMDNFIFCPADLEVTKAIMTLPDDAPVGKSMSEAWGLRDFILDIDNKSITHRPDLWSHFGFARELSGALERPLKNNILETRYPIDLNLKQDVPIEIKDGAAIGYSGAILKNIKITHSPVSIQKRLIVTGMRPINNVVDVSNYVMLEMGQPNHAFDRNQIKQSIVISYSREGETITTLDSKVHKLPAKISLIRDQELPIAIGGVMGGENTEVTEATAEVFLECANFHREDIRRAVSKVGIRSEASQRFEKGQDPNMTVPSIHRFAHLLKETCPELVLGEIKSVFTEETRENEISVSCTYIRQRLGQTSGNADLSNDSIINVLQRLGMRVLSRSGDDLLVKVPSHRSYYDIRIADDLVEEMGRILGYNRIVPAPVMVRCEVPAYRNKSREREHEIRNLLSLRYGYSEIYQYAFCSGEDLAMDTRYASTGVELANPVTQDWKYMRISPLPAFLSTLRANIKKNNRLKLYEIERIFLPSADSATLPTEKVFIAGVVTDKSMKNGMDAELDSVRAEMGDLLQWIGLDRYEQSFSRLEESIFHPRRGGSIGDVRNGKNIIKWGALHPRLLNDAGISQPVVYWEMFLDDIMLYDPFASRYLPPLRLPSAEYDLTVLMDQSQDFSELLKVTGRPQRVVQGKTFIQDVIYLGAFTGGNVPEGKKAVSITLILRNMEKTIDGEEIKKHMESMIRKLDHFGFPLR